MKQSSTTVFLLTFLVALLVLVAAAVFLARDNRVLEQRREELASEQTVLVTANEQLSNDLAVRESALDTAETNLDSVEATRDMLAEELAAQTEQVDILSTQVAQQAANAAEAETAANQPEIQFFTSPPSATVLPDTEMDLFVTVYANNGIANIEVTVDGEVLDSRPGGGEPTAVYNFNWTPEEEATYILQAVGADLSGQMSETKTLTITAAYPSEEARLEALEQEVGAGVNNIRLPEPAETETAGPETQQTVTQTTEIDLHQLFLFGSDSYSETQAQLDELVYRAFRLIPDDFDLLAYSNNLIEQEPLGAYNPDTLAVVVYNPALGEQSAFNRWLTAHSVTHDLQREEFGLDQIDVLALTADNRIALRAMTEGEANYLQFSYLQDPSAFTPEEQVSVTDTLNQQALSLFDDAPPFLRAQFEFAYRYGFQFVQFLFDHGGFELVDNIWDNQPLSSEQILHPESYLAGDAPEVVTVPSLTDVLEGDWQLVRQDTLGEFYLRQHLGQYLSEENVDLAAGGWGGDQYIVYWNAANEELVMALRLAWDDPATDAADFTSAYINYLRSVYQTEPELQADGGRCWQGEDVTCLHQLDLQTLVVRAPDLETAASIAATQTQ